MEEVKKITDSLLTNWQKIDVIKKFLHPKLEYTMRTLLPFRGWARNLDKRVRKMIKIAFRLSRRTNPAIFYVPWRCGGFGLPNIESDLDVAWISQVFKYFTSLDDRIVIMAARRVTDTMAARMNSRRLDLDEVLSFQNSHPDKKEYQRSYDVRSLYNVVRGSLQ